MARNLPQNLELLYQAFSKDAIAGILGGESFTVDGVEFVCSYEPDSTPDRFFLVKSPRLVERYREVCSRFEKPNIMELGIAEGGSTALMALIADPRKLVAIDLEPEPLEALARFISQRHLEDVVRPAYGIDQSDRVGLSQLADREFGGDVIDLVFDDCSHQLGPTRSSFETLFPRMRHGGLYVIEDWNAAHLFQDSVRAALRKQLTEGTEADRERAREEMRRPKPGTTPVKGDQLSTLAIEFMLARASSGEAVEEVTVDEFWITVRRGPGELDHTAFRIDDLYTDYFGLKGW